MCRNVRILVFDGSKSMARSSSSSSNSSSGGGSSTNTKAGQDHSKAKGPRCWMLEFSDNVDQADIKINVRQRMILFLYSQ